MRKRRRNDANRKVGIQVPIKPGKRGKSNRSAFGRVLRTVDNVQKHDFQQLDVFWRISLGVDW